MEDIVRLAWESVWLLGDEIRAKCGFGRKCTSGFSASSTAEEVTEGIDGTGLTAIVTGASSGIGTETTRVLALRGVHVVMGIRNTDSGTKVKEAILMENPDAKIDVMELDLSSMASVRKFASEYKSSGLPLNLLINNAGIMGTPFMLTKDNIELQFGTNHIGHFILTNLLLETMKNTARESHKEGRIVIVSSEGHRFPYRGGVLFDKINNESSYHVVYAYRKSKLANILHASELAKCFKYVGKNMTWNLGLFRFTINQEEGVDITANPLHPGIINTNLFRYHNTFRGLMNIGKYFVKSIPQGAATTCYVALHPQVKGVSGEYFSDNNIGKQSALARDEELAKKLWDFSLSLTDPCGAPC